MNMEQNNQIQTELDIIKAKQAADFALTPAGQTVNQFETFMRMGKMYTTSTIVPAQFKDNLGNCVIALDMATRMNANPLMVMQNLAVVHGTPSFSSKFLIACINASRKFSPLRYEFKGEEGKDDYGCRCVAYEIHDREHRDPLYGDWITMKMAKDEGWSTKNGSKWRTMPGQMLRYRAAAFWQRVYCPEISMGLMTTEEAYDIQDAEYEEIKPAKSKAADIARAQIFGSTPEEKQDEHGQEINEITVDTQTGELFAS